MIKHTNQFGVLSLIIGLIVFYFVCDNLRTNEDNRLRESKSTIRISLINLADLIMLRKNPQLICIDLRRKEFYDNGHMPEAINIPLDDFLKVISEEKLVNFNEKSNIVFYSNSKTSDSIENIVDFLFKKGIEEIKFYSGGWSEWKSCNMPIESNHNE